MINAETFFKRVEDYFYKENIKPSVESHLKLIKDKNDEYYNSLVCDIDFEKHFFEEIYQRYTTTNSGEFYTPQTIIDFLKNYLGDISDKSVVDYAAGVGTLIAQFEAKSKTCIEIKEESSAISGFRGFKSINQSAFDHHDKYDIAIINPPYGIKQYSEFDFINHALKNCDRVVAILPLGVLFRDNMKDNRKEIAKHIKTVFNLPANTFLTTGIPVCLIDITKEENDKIKMVELSTCFDKVGKKNKIKKECYDYHKKEIKGFAKHVDVETLAENDYNLSVTRYVYKEVERVEVDIAALNGKSKELSSQIQDQEDSMNLIFQMIEKIK